jgi:hypothetical protein
VDEVSKTVKAARSKGIDFVVCCGRHSTGGAASIKDGLVIDLRKMNKVTVDSTQKTLAVQGGCTWADVDLEAAKYGLATVGGMYLESSLIEQGDNVPRDSKPHWSRRLDSWRRLWLASISLWVDYRQLPEC